MVKKNSSLASRAKKRLRASLPVLVGREQLKELKKYNNQLKLLHTISSAVCSTLKLDSLFQVVLKQVTTVLSYDRALILLFDRKRQVLHGGRIRGATPKVKQALEGLEIPIDLQYEVFEMVMGKRRPYVANPAIIAQAKGLEREMLDFLDSRAFAVLPLIAKKRLVGILWVDYVKQERLIETADLRLLEQVASQVAIAIDNAQAYQTITDLNVNLEAKVAERTRDLERTGHKLKEAFKTLKDLDQFKNRFFANISHELRTPLTLLLAPLELLFERLRLSSEDRQILSTVKDNAKQLLKMINALLDLTKINAGKMQLRFHKLDMGKSLEEICRRVRPMAEAVGVSLEVQIVEHCFLYVDPDQLIIIVQNLLTNALKFTESGGHVQISMQPDDQVVCVEVRDTGRGIPSEDLPRIFERFAHGEAGRMQGTGIGLALARELVELHGGSLKARSIVGAGTVMTLELKCGKEHLRPEWVVEDDPKIQEEFRAKSGEASLELGILESNFFSGMPQIVEKKNHPQSLRDNTWRILVVEDHPQMLAYLEYILSDRYEIVTARNGEEGLSLANKEQPDLVLTDVGMAGLSGYGLCDALKENILTRNIPIILLTAHVDPDDVVKGLEGHGADDYVTKPFHARELKARIERLLRVREMQSQLLQSDKLAALGQLSAGLAHEVYNPLGFIKSGVAGLRKKMEKLKGECIQASAENNPVMGEFLQQSEWVLQSMEEGIERIYTLVKSLREYSRSDSGKLDRINLNREVELCLRILNAKIKEKNVSIEVDVDKVSFLQARSGQVGQVLMNLLHNAVQAVENNGKVRISAWRQADAKREEIFVQVEDSGCGISKENLRKIFNPFFTTKDPGEGLGLGLSICQQIVRVHGGTIRVESKAGEGTKFTFNIPQVHAAKSIQPPANSISL